MQSIPRQIISSDPRQLFASIREIIAFIAALPRFELKTIETATVTDVTLTTALKVKGVLLVRAYRVDNPDTTVTFTALPDWRLVADGIKIRVNTAAVLHSFTFLIIGT